MLGGHTRLLVTSSSPDLTASRRKPRPPSPWRSPNPSRLGSDAPSLSVLATLPRVLAVGAGLCGAPGAVGTEPGRRSLSAKELTGLSAFSRPRLLHPPHYLHFITAGAAARGGSGAGPAGLPAALGPRRAGEGARVLRAACEAAPARPPAVCLPVGGSAAGAGARGRRAGERVCAPQPGRDAAWPWAP